MDVLIITVLCSLVLAAAGVALFVFRLKDGDFEHGDRLSLLPLDSDEHEVDAKPLTGIPHEKPRSEHGLTQS